MTYPPGYKAWKLCNPLSYPFGNWRTLVWQKLNSIFIHSRILNFLRELPLKALFSVLPLINLRRFRVTHRIDAVISIMIIFLKTNSFQELYISIDLEIHSKSHLQPHLKHILQFSSIHFWSASLPWVLTIVFCVVFPGAA